jgi:hypothetical protein
VGGFVHYLPYDEVDGANTGAAPQVFYAERYVGFNMQRVVSAFSQSYNTLNSDGTWRAPVVMLTQTGVTIDGLAVDMGDYVVLCHFKGSWFVRSVLNKGAFEAQYGPHPELDNGQ